MPRRILPLLLALALPLFAEAQTPMQATRVEVPEWKAVFGRIETKDSIPARTRLGGTLVSIEVSEGAHVEEGQLIGTVSDEKLDLQLRAVDAQLTSLQAQLDNAEAELSRGENLLERGVTTAQRLDALRTQVDVFKGQIGAANADRAVLKQREAEGAVLAPLSGTVLDVPVTAGAVVQPGETIAQIGGGGFFLRLAVPERHAGVLEEGADIQIGTGDQTRTGHLAKIYPQIENGRVIADVEVEGLNEDFVDARVLVRLPVGSTEAVVIPHEAVVSRMGLDFVTVTGSDGMAVQRTVVLGERVEIDGRPMIEVLSGLSGGETLVAGHD
ncbi:efflux RND transporter periplasmic adaptor subunit [Tropicimonas isoalkanivorans]|uniref:RND family efflux transporter, MFP subunit n=1 Tax=Tropicimonas isoalkanivorans TaxID=441112 RepID=A0A1I1PX53_9RHOB|nr:efflux RND transporter periplasmic adaptor subunit [Tropicimonas isoalkanivorans]SFD10470.1 RND family efflux transporter, MFP subunit [Tropicimonas isoalkanivorans]